MRPEGLYVIEWSDGLVKVGRAGSLIGRLAYHMDGRPEASICRFHFVYTADHVEAEREVLAVIKRRHSPIPGKREWFDTLLFEDASALVEAFSSPSADTPIPGAPRRSLADRDEDVLTMLTYLGPSSGRTVAEMLNVSPTTACKSLDRLELAGKAECDPGPRGAKLWRVA
jgi:hypothetical protein